MWLQCNFSHALLLSTLLLSSLAPLHGQAAPPPKISHTELSDSALVKTLSGFRNGSADVNGTRLHFVEGGTGDPLVLLPGWPETWWAFHKIMPELAKHYHVISVDLRGMGSSAKPAAGYEKKNMAKDIYELLKKRGYEKANIAGHDIGSQVAWSFAANYPQATNKLVLMDVPHPDQGLYSWPIIPAVGTFNEKIDEKAPFPWWFAFHQVKGLPEKLLAGRMHLEQEWFFTYLMKDESALSAKDRAIYANAYNSAEAIRAGNAWYQAFPQDIVDEKTYKKLEMPVLGIAGPGYGWLSSTLAAKASNAHTIKLENSGHFVQEEAPAETLKAMLEFLK
jgi:pimeloyl-ACP methyl ester carboxylesterase